MILWVVQCLLLFQVDDQLFTSFFWFKSFIEVLQQFSCFSLFVIESLGQLLQFLGLAVHLLVLIWVQSLQFWFQRLDILTLFGILIFFFFLEPIKRISQPSIIIFFNLSFLLHLINQFLFGRIWIHCILKLFQDLFKFGLHFSFLLFKHVVFQIFLLLKFQICFDFVVVEQGHDFIQLVLIAVCDILKIVLNVFELLDLNVFLVDKLLLCLVTFFQLFTLNRKVPDLVHLRVDGDGILLDCRICFKELITLLLHCLGHIFQILGNILLIFEFLLQLKVLGIFGLQFKLQLTHLVLQVRVQRLVVDLVILKLGD